MSLFPFLCHRVMTFNQEYYYTPSVTAETQKQPADAIPVPLLGACKQPPQTGSCLTSSIASGESSKRGLKVGCTWPPTSFWNHLIISKDLPSHGRMRVEIALEPECCDTAVTRCESTRGLQNTTAMAPVWVDRWPIITWELLGHKSMVYYVPFIMSRITFAWAGNIMI